MDPYSLKTLQEWMFSVITHPQGVEAGISSPPAQNVIPVGSGNLTQVVVSSRNISSQTRLAIYNNAYFARLIECLGAEFPTVRQIVGDDPFAGFVVSYLQSSPPASYTLGDLGGGFPGSLRRTRPDRETESSTPDWADFLIELATLERAYAEVFDGPGEERDAALSLAALQQVPAERWPDVRLRFSRSFRQFHFQFPVHEVISKIRRGDPVEAPVPEDTFLVVHRRQYVVRRFAVLPVQFHLLGELRAGVSLANALESALSSGPEDPEFSPVSLQSWFQSWTAAGLLTGIEFE